MRITQQVVFGNDVISGSNTFIQRAMYVSFSLSFSRLWFVVERFCFVPSDSMNKKCFSHLVAVVLVVISLGTLVA